MAHRDTRKSRVLMAAAGLLFGLVAVWLRVAYLQLACHDHYSKLAEINQVQRVLVPPVRGRLLDWRGRPLARDLLTNAVTAAPKEMQDPAATARDLARVLKLDARTLDRRFRKQPRYVMVARGVSPAVGEAIEGWKRRGVYVSIERRREYALGPAALEILGRTDVDNRGVEGLELQLDDELRGQAGWVTRLRDGLGRAITLDGAPHREPVGGHDVVLTLDSDLQAILESHLMRAADTLRAVRAFGLFLDANTGEVRAAVNVPHLQQGRARNWNFTDQFEPGSTFKIVVAAASLEEGTARPDQWFEASETGEALIAPGARFHDVHKEAAYRFRDAVRWSSNIVMGKLGLLLGPERLYRYAVDLGFGAVTGVSFPGEASGMLRTPDHWSARSCPTIAIGHELSVTPLQLALAYAAIANGGLLMHPMLVDEIRGGDGEPSRRLEPHTSHRVFSLATTQALGLMLASVVDSGTAKAARVPGLAIAGKTGTAQKYDARVHGYGRGMYISSFAGYAPAQEPALVGVVVIDEPRGKHYYGGEVAAPVFREVMKDLQRLPNGPFQPGAPQAVRPPSPAPVAVPDLRLLSRRAAERTLDAYGLRAHWSGVGPRVLAQEPAAGAAVERGASLQVWLAPPTDSAARVLPDLAGLPIREALRRLVRLEVRARIHGEGVVLRQSPEPGTMVPPGRTCELWCQPGLATDARAGIEPAAARATPAPQPGNLAWGRTADGR